MLYKKGVVKELANSNSQKNTSVGVSFNSEYCEIFKSTYFEEDLRAAASEKVHATEKKRLLTRNFCIYIKETNENVCFHFMKETTENKFDWFPLKFVFRYNISVTCEKSE